MTRFPISLNVKIKYPLIILIDSCMQSVWNIQPRREVVWQSPLERRQFFWQVPIKITANKIFGSDDDFLFNRKLRSPTRSDPLFIQFIYEFDCVSSTSRIWIRSNQWQFDSFCKLNSSNNTMGNIFNWKESSSVVCFFNNLYLWNLVPILDWDQPTSIKKRQTKWISNQKRR